MNPIRKSFSDDPLFPFDFIYKDTKSPQRELPDHLHDHYELIYVYRGKGTIFIDQKLYDMSEGDLFIVPGNSIHRAIPDSTDPVTSTALFFLPSLITYEKLDDTYNGLRCFELARKHKLYKLETRTNHSLMNQIIATLDEMQEELEHRSIGYRHSISLQLQQLLLRLNRIAISILSEHTEEARIGPLWMKEVLTFIAQNLDSDLGLSALARQAAVTAAHFSRVFKQLTGMNVTDYVNAKRIALAKELLHETDEGLGWVAERCGYESQPHFHRMFKRITGRTPVAYKRGRANSR